MDSNEEVPADPDHPGAHLRSDRVLLRPPLPSDAEHRLAVGYNREYVRLVGGELPPVNPPYTMDNAQGWVESVQREEHGWVVEVDGLCVGLARLHSLRVKDRCARYAIGIFNPDYWNNGIGLAVTRLVLSYAYNVLRLHRVDLRVLSFNARAIAMYKRAGFLVEGVEREGAWINGRWETDVWMSILEQEYRPDGPTT